MKLPRFSGARDHAAPSVHWWTVAEPRIVPSAGANPCAPNPCPQNAAQANAGQVSCCPMNIGGNLFPICYNPAFNMCVGGQVVPIGGGGGAAAAPAA